MQYRKISGATAILLLIVTSCKTSISQNLRGQSEQPSLGASVSTPEQGYSEAQKRIQEALETQNTWLDLRFLSLTKIPPELWQLSHLQRLELEENQLETLPPEIGTFKGLRYLTLTYNPLSSLPHEIGRLNHLEYLNLSYAGKLSTLPPEF